jgi:hypothetical protein
LHPLRDDQAYLNLKREGYVTVPKLFSVTPHDLVEEINDADFSPGTIKARMLKGYDETKKVLANPASWRLICERATKTTSGPSSTTQTSLGR